MTVIPARTDTDYADRRTPAADTGDEPGLDITALTPPPEPARPALDTADQGDRLDQSWILPTDDDDQPLAY